MCIDQWRCEAFADYLTPYGTGWTAFASDPDKTGHWKGIMEQYIIPVCVCVCVCIPRATWHRCNTGRGRSAYRDGPLHPRGHGLWVDVCSGLCWVSKMTDCRWIRELLLPGRLSRSRCSWSPCLTSGHPGSSRETDDGHHQWAHLAVSLSRGDQVLLHAALSRGPPAHRICQSRIHIVILLLNVGGRGRWNKTQLIADILL